MTVVMLQCLVSKLGSIAPGLLALGMLTLVSGPAPAQTVTPNRIDIEKAFRKSQDAIGKALPEYTFKDTSGRDVKLSEFQGKPLILTFIYTSCSSSCPTITTRLVDAVEDAEKSLGPGTFTVASIGFDAPVDKPEAMAEFRDLYAVKTPHWKFLSGDLISVTDLADSLGYTFIPGTDNEGFEHLAQVTVLGKQGEVYRQVYGDDFPLPNLVEPLKEVAWGTEKPFSSVNELINKVKLFCVTYDPKAGIYRFDYTPFVQMGVSFSVVVFLAVFLVRNSLRLRRRGNGGNGGRQTLKDA